MTSKHSMYQLTPYQNAMLTHMGILCWKSKDKSNLPSAPKVMTGELPKANRVPTVEQKQAGLAKLKQQMLTEETPTSIDAKQNIVLCFSEQSANEQLVADVLIWFGVDERSIIWAEKTLDHYHNYVFAWCIDEQLSYKDNRLFTPPFNKLTSTLGKKRLWASLQQYTA